MSLSSSTFLPPVPTQSEVIECAFIIPAASAVEAETMSVGQLAASCLRLKGKSSPTSSVSAAMRRRSVRVESSPSGFVCTLPSASL